MHSLSCKQVKVDADVGGQNFSIRAIKATYLDYKRCWKHCPYSCMHSVM